MQTLSSTRVRLFLFFLTAAALCLFLAFRFQNRQHSHASVAPSSYRMSQLPPVILWAWERREKLDFADSRKIGVAFLAKTIYLREDRVISRPRLQPLTVADGSPVVAVARIESARFNPPRLSREQIKITAAEIAKLGDLPNVIMVQVDFDATTSERAFYRQLLAELRAKLSQSTALSITALASWCQGDNWLEDLPVDEAVPMLFRMGVERQQFRTKLAAGVQFNSKLCQASAGVSTDEPLPHWPRVQRLYVFNPEAWSPEAVNQMMESYRK